VIRLRSSGCSERTAARRIAGLAAALVVMSLAGCSDDPYESYCSVVEENQQELSEILGAGGPAALLKALPIFRELQAEAPDDIRDDWKVVTSGLSALEDALDDADVDAATYDREDPPEGLTEEEKARIDAAAQQLTTPGSTAAFAAVEQQARDVCHTPLRL
jgi:hypothetical protein